MSKPKFRLSLKISLIFLSIFLFSFIPNDLQRGGSSQWVVLPSLPFSQEYHVAAGWKNGDTNFVITAGGRVNDTVSNKVLLFNTKTNVYRPLRNLPIALERSGGFVLGDSLYIVGGISSQPGNFVNFTMKLNLKDTGASWVPRAPFPMPIGEITHSTTARNDSLAYVAGGRTAGSIGPLNTVFIYNGKSNVWIPAGTLPEAFYGAGLSFLRDTTMMLIGGRRGDTISSRTFMGMINPNDPAAITWVPGPPYPGGHIFYVGNWGSKRGKIFFTGGSSSIDPRDNGRSTDNTFEFDDQNGYDTLADKPTPISHGQIIGSDNSYLGGPDTTYEIYAAGGSSDNNDVSFNVHEKLIVVDSNTVSINTIGTEIPGGFLLKQNYPNPFNPFTKIYFDIPKAGKVRLTVYSSIGKEITTLVNKDLTAGSYEALLDASGFTSGIYFYRLEAEGWSDVKKMVMLK